MFQKGDYIVYRNTGVCHVADISTRENFSAGGEAQLYYHLVPVHGAGTIYIPVDSPVFMRHVISKEQAQALLAAIPQMERTPNYNKNQKALAEQYRTILHTHDCTALAQMILNISKKPAI